MRRRVFVALAVATALALAGWGFFKASPGSAPAETAFADGVPVTSVKRGDVVFAVVAKGQLLGGNSQRLVAPMVGSQELVITELRQPGEIANKGDVVAQFDTTEQEYELHEAEADLAEAEQQVKRAKAETEARKEETRLALANAEAQVKLAELECRKNTLVSAITARQNDLALEAARDELRQLREDLSNQSATSLATIAIQDAVQKKAQVRAETARRNIETMTLRAAESGYVALEQNTYGGGMFYFGMEVPIFQVGDTIRAGMAVAQIPDLSSWEVTARIGELDRGHLAEGQPVSVRVVAVPERAFRGKLKHIGGTTGPPWDRHFDCRIQLEEISPALRQGMSAQLEIISGEAKNVLWLPSQALFESDGRHYVYLRQKNGFRTQDVELKRRSESRAVVEGIAENDVVALASPDQIRDAAGAAQAGGGVMNAIPK
ncbi:MAG: HlyD family efflux transporter periplasmic adaptor subunit [Bryobacterales bacterium]|nr:HlyD family efflux transporter periplasmic adaptor subunit [Bryobacterales bacterium]